MTSKPGGRSHDLREHQRRTKQEDRRLRKAQRRKEKATIGTGNAEKEESNNDQNR